MKKRGDYLKKEYYHLMKIEQKKNKIFKINFAGIKILAFRELAV